MASTIAVFYTVGGLSGLLLVLGSDVQATQRDVLLGLSLSALVSALVVVRWARRWPRRAFHAPVASAAVLIDCAVLMSPDAGSAVAAAAMTSFIVFDAYLFFSPHVATAHLVFGLVGVTGALMAHSDVTLTTALALDAVMTTLGAVTRNLVNRASGASRDPLTDLLNRRGFDQAMQERLGSASRSGERLSAALMDLDDFKAVNDAHGHEAGDQVLRQVAETWSHALPPRAVLARHGGDEFALLLPGLAGPAALELVRRLSDRHPGVRLSGGVAEHAPGDSAAQLMRRADQALYTAKAAGRGRCELAGGATDDLVRDLAAALDAGDVQVHFQPIVQLATDTVRGVEALARWTHPERGPVSPAEFIATAEQHGLIGALGEHVLRTSCRQLAALHATTGRRLRLGVNVSGLELNDPDYPERVRRVLAETGWPATQTVLEVTESLLAAESTTAIATLHVLRGMGMGVSLDDFGTGYSSFSRLDTLPVDILKVDSSFIATITTSPRRAQMLRSIVGMAEALGLDVVAEGVETAEQDARLHDVRCSFGQGWLYGRPMPLAELAAVLGARPPDVPAQRRDTPGTGRSAGHLAGLTP